ncbi:conserved hypothetical protein [Methylomarinovum tepidoasis]|uniref:Probable membrane transporter protein n=1 Tax=Methylomarinovum tepidoasis TaxID=2840183 RepID=A0AAU9D045_9GAMM|nr:sulfite exporter TauE/SafE family protein [Methylomarinovum sp. IN45]BCX89684.1 conserved hypothetical protein [Methylomarinovum sp. IN45]
MSLAELLHFLGTPPVCSWLLLWCLLFFVAIFFSMLGQGGGTLYTPIQVLFGIDFHVAATTSLFLIMVTSLSATLVYRRANKVDWPLALVLESVTTLGGFVGGVGSAWFSGRVLSWLFAGVVAFAAVFMIRQWQPRPRPVSRPKWYLWRRRYDGHVFAVNLLLALPVSFLAGMVSGMVGVGGGIMKVPLMVLLLGIPMDIAVGTSALMVGVTAAGGFAGHLVAGHWDWHLSLMLALAVFLGGQIGARRALKLDRVRMKRLFGWFLLAIAVVMVVRNGGVADLVQLLEGLRQMLSQAPGAGIVICL